MLSFWRQRKIILFLLKYEMGRSSSIFFDEILEQDFVRHLIFKKRYAYPWRFYVFSKYHGKTTTKGAVLARRQRNKIQFAIERNIRDGYIKSNGGYGSDRRISVTTNGKEFVEISNFTEQFLRRYSNVLVPLTTFTVGALGGVLGSEKFKDLVELLKN